MAAVVRIFTFSEIITAPVAASSGRYSTDSVGLLKHPYLGRDQVTAGTGAAVATSASAAPDSTRLVQVQVEPGKIVHYEAVPQGQERTAATTSPFISGTTLIHFGPGWTLSFLEASF